MGDPASTSLVYKILDGVTRERPKVDSRTRHKHAVPIYKYIQERSLKVTLGDFFEAWAHFPEAEPDLIVKGLINTSNKEIRTCRCCGKEFITDKYYFLCRYCRNKA